MLAWPKHHGTVTSRSMMLLVTQRANFECLWCAQTTRAMCSHAGAQSFFFVEARSLRRASATATLYRCCRQRDYMAIQQGASHTAEHYEMDLLDGDASVLIVVIPIHRQQILWCQGTVTGIGDPTDSALKSIPFLRRRHDDSMIHQCLRHSSISVPIWAILTIFGVLINGVSAKSFRHAALRAVWTECHAHRYRWQTRRRVRAPICSFIVDTRTQAFSTRTKSTLRAWEHIAPTIWVVTRPAPSSRTSTPHELVRKLPSPRIEHVLRGTLVGRHAMGLRNRPFWTCVRGVCRSL